jgi:glyoxylate reductase
MKPKVFVTRKIPESGIDILRKHCHIKVYKNNQVITRDELLKGVKWCDALLCLLTDKIDADIMDANPCLKVISNYAVGFDNIDIQAATDRKIPVTNTPGVLTEAVAEHTFALLISIARRIAESDRFSRADKYTGWEPMLLLGTELAGKTLGIVGLGRIGEALTRRAHAMGLKISYYDVRKNTDFEKRYGAKYLSLNTLLKKADFITLHVPLLASTKHLIGAPQLKLMKKTAYLINTSRGPVVDEKALVAALKKKEIAGAALDVFEFEPKFAPGLLKLENVLLTPHTASATLETRSAMSELAAKNLLEVLQGKRPKNLVNREVKIRKS